MHFEASTEVAARARHVYDVYADVERWPVWTSSVTSVERLDDGPLRVGARARVRQPRLPVVVWEVTDLVPGEQFTWVARGPGLRTTGRHRVTPNADGTVTVTTTIDQEGPMGWLVGTVFRGLTDRYLRIEARGIKAYCER